MSYATLIAKRPQLVGYRVKIAGVRYCFTSSSLVPTPTEAGGTIGYTAKKALLEPLPRTMPLQASPFDPVFVGTAEVRLADIDGVLSDLWATERQSPVVELDANLSAAGASISTRRFAGAAGLASFDAAPGLCYIDGECIEYSAVNTGTGEITVSASGTGGRGKFGSVARAHSEYELASQMSRPVYGFLPNLWGRLVTVEIFDLENTANYATVAKGFLTEPYWESSEVFRFQVKGYADLLNRPMFRRTIVTGRVAKGGGFQSWGDDTIPKNQSQNGNPEPQDPNYGYRDRLRYAYVDPQQLWAAADAFYDPDAAGYPAAHSDWMPQKLAFLLVGGSDGEIIAYNSITQATSPYAFVLKARGCWGTKLQDWKPGTSIQQLGVIGGEVNHYTLLTNPPKRRATWDERLQGVNIIKALLYLLFSDQGDGTVDATYDVLPADTGLGHLLDTTLVDKTAFETFQQNFASGRNHVFLVSEPTPLLDFIQNELALPYGALVYTTREGKLTVASLQGYLPGETVTDIPQSEVIGNIEFIGVALVTNTLQFKLDTWPTQEGGPTTVNAYDYRRRDVIGEAAKNVECKTLRGPGFYPPLGGKDLLCNRAVDWLDLFGNGAPVIEWYAILKHADREPGQYVALTHDQPPKLVATGRGFVAQKIQLLAVTCEEDQARVRLKGVVLPDTKFCRIPPSAEIATIVTATTVFTILSSQFCDDDRDVNFWKAGTVIWIWDANLSSYVDRVVQTYVALTGTITLSVSYGDLAVGQIITWPDWDSMKAGGGEQPARQDRYGYLADSGNTLGSSGDPARQWM